MNCGNDGSTSADNSVARPILALWTTLSGPSLRKNHLKMCSSSLKIKPFLVHPVFYLVFFGCNSAGLHSLPELQQRVRRSKHRRTNMPSENRRSGRNFFESTLILSHKSCAPVTSVTSLQLSESAKFLKGKTRSSYLNLRAYAPAFCNQQSVFEFPQR